MSISTVLQRHPNFANTIKNTPKLLAISIALITASHPIYAAPANAKDAKKAGDIDEVVVTAQRRSELAVDVPISITAIDAEQLTNSDVHQLSDISKLTPSLRFDNAGAQSQPTIRGVGTSVAVAGGSSNVGIYVDGFYSPNPVTADFDLLNVSSVQVLKGPQGTLFGRNSTGGAILVTTKEPSLTPSADMAVSYGSYNTQGYQLYATGGLNDMLAVDVAGQIRKSDGFVTNTLTHSDTDAAYNNSSIRIGAKLDATDKLSMLLRYTYSDRDDNSAVAENAYEQDGKVYSMAATFGSDVATKRGKVSNNFKPSFTSVASTTQLTLKYDLDFALLSSYTQYRDERAKNLMDFDMSPMSIFHYRFDNVDTVFTQEFLLASTGQDRLQWTTGLFYFDNGAYYENNQSSLGGAAFVRDGGSGVKVNTIAGYGDATYAILDDLFLTLGARYSKDTIDHAYYMYLDSNNNLTRADLPKIDDDQITPRVVLRYKLNENSSTYISYTEGYKSAIINVGGGNNVTEHNVKPEKIKAYEVGYKFSSGPLMLDLSSYYYDYKNLQIASYSGNASYIQNAATSHIYGADGQARYAFSEQWEANIGIAYIHSKYDKFDDSQIWVQCLAAACGQSYGVYIPQYADASGNEMQHAPKLSGTLGLIYRTDLANGSLAISGNVYHTSSFYFDSSNNYKQDAYNLLGMRAEWTNPSKFYTVAVYGDNLTDKEYRNQVLPQFYGALSTWGAPRTVGVSVALHY